MTLHAAVELQIITDLERQHGFRMTSEFVKSEAFRDLALRYRPSSKAEEITLATYSSDYGGRYGSSTALVQLQTLGAAIAARRSLHLLDEVEWVQLDRSFALTRMAVIRPDLGLAGGDQLNITLLFGFSPRLAFPKTYEEFRAAVRLAKSLETERTFRRSNLRISITVGAAVHPRHALSEVAPIDIGPERGQSMDALRRLAAYAAQEDSEVDILRVGMEDTPYVVKDNHFIETTNNVQLLRIAADIVGRHGRPLLLDASALSERRAPLIRTTAA